jgi:hypothetical protein
MWLDDLRHRAIVDPDAAGRIGVVTDDWIDSAAGHVAALIIRPVDADLSQRCRPSASRASDAMR